MQDFMIDLETMGKGNNALITTVSIVQFDLKTGEVGAEIEKGIGWDTQVNFGAVMDVNTVRWWMTQDKEAIDAMMRLEQHSVSEVVSAINAFFAVNCTDINNATLWGNGATFDNVIIRNLYERHGEVFPLPFWCDKDVRTLTYIAEVEPRNFAFEGIKHRGIDDCKHQINYCCHAYRKYKGL